MKRIIAMLLALILLFTSTGEILASEIASGENDVLSVNELEFPTGLQEVEAIAIPVSELTGEILDYRELAEISTYSAVYAKEWDKYSTNYYYNQLPLEWKKLWDAMDTVCLSYLTSSANVEKAMFDAVSTPSGMTLDELHIFWQMFIYSNPQYYFLLNQYSYSAYENAKDFPVAISLMCYDDFCYGSDRAVATDQFLTQIEAWEKELENYATDKEKVKKIHDLICEKVTYNNAAANGSVSEQVSFSQSPFSVVCMDSTVCAGYADTMTIMCNAVGIDTISVTSYNHQWNKIRIDDSWYNYDATWGDQNSGIYYKYFARSDAFYKSDHASHVEETFWAPYSPKATQDTIQSGSWSVPGTYPVIENKTVSPEITIIQNEGKLVVIITCGTENADIYYTLDGTRPSPAFTKAVKYTGSFIVETGTQVKAVAVCNTYLDSDIVSKIAEVTPNPEPEPDPNPEPEPEVYTYTITYELNGGRNHELNPATYQSNAEEFVLYPASRDGYRFDGWYYDSSFSEPATTILGSCGNITVYAKWVKEYISIEGAKISYSTNFIYDGTAKISNIGVYLADKELTLNKDFIVSYENNINAGTATAIITGIGDYTGILYRSYTILPYQIKNTRIELSQIGFIYNGTEHKPAVTVWMGDRLLELDTEYTLNYANNVQAGTATVTITGVGNFKGSVEQYFFIDEPVVTYLVRFDPNGGKNLSESTRTVEENKAIGTLPTVERDGYVFKGWYTATTGGEKITVETVITSAITFYAQWEKIIISMDKAVVELSTESFVYDGKAKQPAVTVTLDGKTLVASTDYIVSYANNVAVGTAVVTVTGKGDYTGTISKTYTIDAASLKDATVTLNKSKYDYDGKSKNPSVTIMLAGKKLVLDTDYIVNYKNNKNIGTATVTITGKGNYTGSLSKTFIIKEKKGTTFTSGSYKYKVTSSSAVAFAGLKSDKTTKVSIPKNVKYGGKTFKVTSVADKALKGKTKVTEITISDNVTSICTNAFAGCTKLSKVTIGKNVKTIGTSAFEGCKKLSKVSIGNAVTTIGDKAFKNCTSLKSITIPGKVTKIGKQAFYGCKNLKTITIKSTKLKIVGKDALKGINAKATIKVPKSKLSAYKKLLKGKGQGSKVKIVKY